jgi:RNA polymerase sigma factor (sigma-70 family)
MERRVSAVATARRSRSRDPVEAAALRQVVERAASGDDGAWRELVTRFDGLVRAVTRAYGLYEADADDVAQVSWLRLVEHVDRVEDPERVGPWLVTTAKRECLRVHRQNARADASDDDLEERPDHAPGHSSPLLRRERAAVLRAGVAALRPREARLLRMLFADPTPSYEEIGRALDMPIGSIGPTRARALRRLADQVQRLGLYPSALEDCG